MNNKLNCQLINILLTKNNEFANKYTSIISGNFDYETLLNDYYKNKEMRSIRIDNNTQSICFTNQNNMMSIYNSETRQTESYYEEVHIHCNSLSMFNNFSNYLKNSEYKNVVNDTGGIPHSESIKIENLKKCELVMEPMTNEVATTKSLLNLLSKNSDETIFRAVAIHFGKLVNRPSEIDYDLIQKLNNIYDKNVDGNEYSIFSEEVSNQFLNLDNDEKSHETRIAKIPSKNFGYIEESENHIFYTNQDNDFENSY